MYKQYGQLDLLLNLVKKAERHKSTVISFYRNNEPFILKGTMFKVNKIQTHWHTQESTDRVHTVDFQRTSLMCQHVMVIF